MSRAEEAALNTRGLLGRLDSVQPLVFEGQVTQVVGTLVEAEVPGAALGTTSWPEN